MNGCVRVLEKLVHKRARENLVVFSYGFAEILKRGFDRGFARELAAVVRPQSVGNGNANRVVRHRVIDVVLIVPSAAFFAYRSNVHNLSPD